MEMGWVISAGHIWPPSLLLGANPECVWCVCSCKHEKWLPHLQSILQRKGGRQRSPCGCCLFIRQSLSLCARFDWAGSDADALIGAVQFPHTCFYFSAQWSERMGWEGERKSCGCVNSLWPKHQSAWKQRRWVGGREGRRRERKMGKNECLCACRV